MCHRRENFWSVLYLKVHLWRVRVRSVQSSETTFLLLVRVYTSHHVRLYDGLYYLSTHTFQLYTTSANSNCLATTTTGTISTITTIIITVTIATAILLSFFMHHTYKQHERILCVFVCSISVYVYPRMCILCIHVYTHVNRLYTCVYVHVRKHVYVRTYM